MINFLNFFRHDIDPDNFDIELDVISSTLTNHTQINPDSGNFSTSGDYNDDKESMSENHSESNATPPIDLLTPYVEISMIDPTASFLQVSIHLKCLNIIQILYYLIIKCYYTI